METRFHSPEICHVIELLSRNLDEPSRKKVWESLGSDHGKEFRELTDKYKGVLPKLNRRGIAALGVKSFGGSGEMLRKGAVTPREALSYTLSLPAAVIISGVDRMEVLHQNLEIASGFRPLQAAASEALRQRCRPYVADGHLELFKMTVKYDGKIGREEHQFPSEEELPL